MSSILLVALAVLMLPVSDAHAMLLCARSNNVTGQIQENAAIRLRSTCKSSEIALPLSIEDAGQTVRVTGADLQIVNGTGTTASANGTGNLIVGYNDFDPDEPADRTGSHNLV